MVSTTTDHRPSCPHVSTLRQWVADELPESDADLIEKHVGECPSCQRAMDRLAGGLSELFPSMMVMPGRAEEERPPQLDGYEPLARIGEGSWGVVWRVRDLQFDRELALKVMRSRDCDDPDRARRFFTEARITGQLAHPFIVPIHSLGRLADGRPYYTMKLVGGDTLEALLKSRPHPASERMKFVQVFAHVCQALASAHEKGVIHRDLKPHNIMVGDFDEVQLMDWGMAKKLGPIVDVEAPSHLAWGPTDTHQLQSSDHTAAGSVMGTWAYMPPEQANGRLDQVDRRSDVFGLGAILCKILTGEPPYVGPDDDDIRTEVIMREAKAARLEGAMDRLRNCGADPELIDLAKRCLAPNKSDRPANAGELAVAVADYLATEQERRRKEREEQEVRAALRRRRGRILAAMTLVVMTSLTGGLVASLTFAHRADVARRESARQSKVALDLTAALLALADPENAPTRSTKAREAALQAARELDMGFLRDPKADADLRTQLGKVFFNLGDYRRSRDQFAAAYRTSKEHLGEKHPTSMTALDQLGKAYMYLEEYADAIAVLRKAHDLQVETLGPEDEDTIHSYAKIGDVCAKMGDFESAEKIQKEVLEVRLRKGGEENEFTLVSLNNLATLYEKMGLEEQALPFFEAVERIAKRSLGELHPSTLRYTGNRAGACLSLGRLEEARRLYVDCLSKERMVLGEIHPSVMNDELNFIVLMTRQEDYDEALRLCESLKSRLERAAPEERDSMGRVLLSMGRCYGAKGNTQEAETCLGKAHEMFLEKFGAEHFATRAALEALQALRDREAEGVGGRVPRYDDPGH